MTMMNPNIGAMQAASLPPVWRTPPGQSMSPAQYAQSQGRNWSQAVNDRNFMQGYYGNMQSGPDYSGGRYVPPTFAFGYGSNGQIDPSRMMWNEQRNYYTPEQNYRFPTMPNFGMMEGIGNYGMNPFQQMMQMQQMGWLMGGRGGPWNGGGMDYSGGAAELFRRGGGEQEYGSFPEETYEDFLAGYNSGWSGPRPDGVITTGERSPPPTREQWQEVRDLERRYGRQTFFGANQGGGSYEDYVRNYTPEERDPNMMYTAVRQPGRDVPLSREDWERYMGGGRGGRMGGRPMMPMFGGGMFSPYFGFGGLGGMLPGGGRFGSRPPQGSGYKPATLPQIGPQSGPPAPGGG